MRTGRWLRIVALAWCLAAGLQAATRLPRIFTDHMILQRGKAIQVWGWDEAGQEVTIRFGSAQAVATTDQTGRWHAKLPAHPASAQGREFRVQGSTTVTLKDVLVGDVWLCSGQSNMGMSVRSSLNAEKEVAQSKDPLLRHFAVHYSILPAPADDVNGRWETATPDVVGGWSAVAYYFGRDLRRSQRVPVGLINSSFGGTPIEAWMSHRALATFRDMKGALKRLELKGQSREASQAQLESEVADYLKAVCKLSEMENDAVHQNRYADPKLDHSSWQKMKVCSDWERQGHRRLDGEVWFRRTVTIPAGWKGRELLLGLGGIDEVDSTFVNGEKVGGLGTVCPVSTRYWNTPRRYVVPARLVTGTKLVIAVRVADQLWQGGMRGKASDYFVVPNDERDSAAKRVDLTGAWSYKIALALPIKPHWPEAPGTATVLFNGMINGLVPFRIKGAIWYQGEANAGRAYLYRDRLKTMIQDWRTRWGQDDFPFLVVQLPNWRKVATTPEDTNWPVMRESQLKILDLPQTGVAVTIDVGEVRDIHPRNKQVVGHRLALEARRVADGETLVSHGPFYKSMAVEGSSIRLHFDLQGSELKADGPLQRFAIAGKDKRFVWAEARIDGKTVVVQSAKVKEPVAVRYAWAMNPEGCNLRNREGLPASPFRTDTWKVKTQ